MWLYPPEIIFITIIQVRWASTWRIIPYIPLLSSQSLRLFMLNLSLQLAGCDRLVCGGEDRVFIGAIWRNCSISIHWEWNLYCFRQGCINLATILTSCTYVRCRRWSHVIPNYVGYLGLGRRTLQGLWGFRLSSDYWKLWHLYLLRVIWRAEKGFKLWTRNLNNCFNAYIPCLSCASVTCQNILAIRLRDSREILTKNVPHGGATTRGNLTLEQMNCVCWLGHSHHSAFAKART